MSGPCWRETGRAREALTHRIWPTSSWRPSSTSSPPRAPSRRFTVRGLPWSRTWTITDSYVSSRAQGVPVVLWIVLIVGGVLTVSFAFLFGMKAPWLHRLSMASLTVLVVLILYTIHLIEYPFTSDVSVPPAALESVSDRMEGGTNS